VAKIFRICKFRTTVFHPQSNGSLERSHHALGEYLKQYTNEQKQWDRWISLAMFNYNTSVHEATKHTPYEFAEFKPTNFAELSLCYSLTTLVNMELSMQSSEVATPSAIPETKERTKRKGPKPSSKKRLEKFCLEKSRETMAEIHRQAIESTTVSVDALLKCLADLQLVAQKQEVVIPVTTRGVGLLVNECYEEAKLQCPKTVRECSVHKFYRIFRWHSFNVNLIYLTPHVHYLSIRYNSKSSIK